MSADGHTRPEQAAPPTVRALERQYESSDDGSFAFFLVEHPRLATDAGLGGLAQVLRQNAGYAAERGWALALTRVLDAHPRYAAGHHLSATPPAPGKTTSATAGATKAAGSSSAASPGAAAAATVTVRDPLSIAIGGTLDVTLPDLGLTGALTYTITPQPLPANMTFNRATGELAFAPAQARRARTIFPSP